MPGRVVPESALIEAKKKVVTGMGNINNYCEILKGYVDKFPELTASLGSLWNTEGGVKVKEKLNGKVEDITREIIKFMQAISEADTAEGISFSKKENQEILPGGRSVNL